MLAFTEQFTSHGLDTVMMGQQKLEPTESSRLECEKELDRGINPGQSPPPTSDSDCQSAPA
jgi:hypothetical protein